MSDVQLKSRSARSLSADLDPQAEIAAKALSGLDEMHSTRLVQTYSLKDLRPSPANPRRADLDKAGVSMEWIEKLKLRDGEEVSAWTDRLDEYLAGVKSKLDADSLKLMEDIVGLSFSILNSGLLQPITANPDGEILMGECRWTASLLCNKPYNQVIIRKFEKDLLKAIRFLENDKRSNLSAAATVQAVRMITEDKIKAKCGFDNPDISINLMRDLFGAKTTKSAYYLSFCRLPEDDELLIQIYAGAYRGIRTAYEACVVRIEQLKSFSSKQQLDDQGSTPPLQPKTKKKPASAYSTKYPPVKTRLPGTIGGKALFQALNALEGIPDEAKTAFSNALKSWEGAPDNARKNIFANTMNQFFAMVDPEDELQEQPGSNNGAA